MCLKLFMKELASFRSVVFLISITENVSLTNQMCLATVYLYIQALQGPSIYYQRLSSP
jgi:hypothetical protein